MNSETKTTEEKVTETGPGMFAGKHSTESPWTGKQSVFARVPVEEIARNPKQPRRTFDAEALEALAESIKTEGLMQPVILRRADVIDPDDKKRACRFVIVAGERRWRAHRLLAADASIKDKRFDEVDAKVIAADEAKTAAMALVENLHRQDLNAMEEARGYGELIALGLTQEEIARRVTRSRPVVANALRLLELPKATQQLIAEGELSAKHGLHLLKFKAWPKACNRIAELAAKSSYSAEQLDRDGLPFGWDMSNSRPRLAVQIAREDVAKLELTDEELEKQPWFFGVRWSHHAKAQAYDERWSMDPEKSGSWLAERENAIEAKRAAEIADAKKQIAEAKAAKKPAPKAALKAIERAKQPARAETDAYGRRSKGPMTAAEKAQRKRRIDTNRKNREAVEAAFSTAVETLKEIKDVRSEELAHIAGWAVRGDYGFNPTGAMKAAAGLLGIAVPKRFEEMRPVDLVRCMVLFQITRVCNVARKFSESLPAEVKPYAKGYEKRLKVDGRRAAPGRKTKAAA